LYIARLEAAVDVDVSLPRAEVKFIGGGEGLFVVGFIFIHLGDYMFRVALLHDGVGLKNKGRDGDQ
jgi:hypothetical protein